MTKGVQLVTTCAIAINKTRALAERALDSLTRFYPDMSIILIDNGSKAGSDVGQWAARLAQHNEKIYTHKIPSDVGSGPALARAFAIASTPFILTLASHVVVKRGMLVENMFHELTESARALGVGRVYKVDAFGKNGQRAEIHPRIPYLDPECALWNRSMYNQLGEIFLDHIAPAIRVCYAAAMAKNKTPVMRFPVREYVDMRSRSVRPLRALPSTIWSPAELESMGYDPVSMRFALCKPTREQEIEARMNVSRETMPDATCGERVQEAIDFVESAGHE